MYSMFQPDPNIDIEQLRVRFGYRVILAAFILVAVSLVVVWSLWASRGSADIKLTDLIAIVSTVTGLAGTVVGAFFGVSASAAARDQANQARQASQEIANKALAQLPPEKAAAVLAHDPPSA
jgi:hypothetical protein